MKTRKITAVILSLVMLVSVIGTFSVSAAGKDKLCFHDDGTFNILMINDVQEKDKISDKALNFIKMTVRQEKADLVVIAGDQFSDVWGSCTEKGLDANMKIMCDLFAELQVHFAFTMGNHDWDRVDDCSSLKHVMDVFSASPWHVSIDDHCEGSEDTYSIPVYSADGAKVEYVVYMMDSNNKSAALSMSGYTGVYANQIEWFNDTAAAYREANGGENVPSSVIQHVPVAEIYDFLTEVPMAEYLSSDVVFSTNDNKWYKLDKAAYPDMTGVMGEGPCSEIESTGEYAAMVENGVVSAFFAHDHVNNFAATTKDGVYMGYNGGTGFGSYGNGDNRSCRIIKLNENDLTKCDSESSYLAFYGDVTGDTFSVYKSDIISPKIVTVLMKILVVIPSLFCRIFKIK